MSDRTRRNFGRVMKRDGGRCRYCGELADSVDHVMPWAYRPNNSPSNLVAACMRCNLIASDLVFASFEARRAYIRTARGLEPVRPPRALPAAAPVAAKPEPRETLAEAKGDDRLRAAKRKQQRMAAASAHFRKSW
jgi:hypothetical protein